MEVDTVDDEGLIHAHVLPGDLLTVAVEDEIGDVVDRGAGCLIVSVAEGHGLGGQPGSETDLLRNADREVECVVAEAEEGTHEERSHDGHVAGVSESGAERRPVESVGEQRCTVGILDDAVAILGETPPNHGLRLVDGHRRGELRVVARAMEIAVPR